MAPRKKTGKRQRPDAAKREAENLSAENTGKDAEDLDRNLAPPREATLIRSNEEREAEEHAELYTSTSPVLTGGDPDADWERAASSGEEAVGGTVETPDQNVVEDLTRAVGVPRGLDEPVRTSEEILTERDRHRWDEEANERDE
jgi:hypothetical protein